MSLSMASRRERSWTAESGRSSRSSTTRHIRAGRAERRPGRPLPGAERAATRPARGDRPVPPGRAERRAGRRAARGAGRHGQGTARARTSGARPPARRRRRRGAATMNDLQTKLERLTSQATALAPVPEVERVLRRGRRRRRRRAGTALLAVALAGAGTAGIWQAQRATDRRTTVAPPPAAASLNAYLGWWQDNIDASLFLRDGISAEQRAALGRRLESEPEVTRVWFESRQQALARWVASGSPGAGGKVTAAD